MPGTSANLMLGGLFVTVGAVNVWLILQASARVKNAGASARLIAAHRVGGYIFILLPLPVRSLKPGAIWSKKMSLARRTKPKWGLNYSRAEVECLRLPAWQIDFGCKVLWTKATYGGADEVSRVARQWAAARVWLASENAEPSSLAGLAGLEKRTSERV